MIVAAGIPVIDGDMDALAGHARELTTLGGAVADTGADVHSTWQGLAVPYDAPETAELLAATLPVRRACDDIGEDLAAAGAALVVYSEEVRAIQVRLDALRAQATAFEADLAAAGEADDDLTERSDALVVAVNAAVADFETAQRDCANAISALHGGPALRVDDGDGVLAPGEFGSTAGQLDTYAQGAGGVAWSSGDPPPEEEGGGWFSGIGHAVLDVAGLVPVVGEAADGINAAWYLAEGDHTSAALSAAAMVPFVGWGATAAKGGLRVADAARGADGAVSYARPSGFRSGVRDSVWDTARNPVTGQVRDPVTGRFMSPDKPWDMGHLPGYEFRKHQRDAADRGLPRDRFLDEYNDPSHYRPELPSSNRSHRGEDDTDAYLGP